MPCGVCGELGVDDKAILCGQCDRPYHAFCLNPPLDGFSGGDWFCPDCAPSARPEKRKRGRPPKRAQTGVHSGGGMLARGSATSATVESGPDGASNGPEFESAKKAAIQRAREGGGEVGAERKAGRPSKPLGDVAEGVRRPGRGKHYQEPGCEKSAQGALRGKALPGAGMRQGRTGRDRPLQGAWREQASPGAGVRQERTEARQIAA